MWGWGVSVLLLLLALWLLSLSYRQRRRVGLPPGQVVYEDMGRWTRCQDVLHDAEHGLVGRPDYVVRQGRKVIPVEVKPRRHAEVPYDSDIYQLAAYCLLVEANYGRPDYGLLRYAERTFRIPYTWSLRRELLRVVERIHCDRDARRVVPNHDAPARCGGCGYRDRCTYRLD